MSGSDSLQVPGRKLHERCPACGRGRLRPVTKNISGSNGIKGPAGASWNVDVIERLACSHCSVSFEAEPQLRGISLMKFIDDQTEKTLQDQLEKIGRGMGKPERCAKIDCDGMELVVWKDFLPFSGHDPSYGTTFYRSYCPGCYQLYWVHSESSDPLNLDEEVGVDEFEFDMGEN